jgi:hypothetical protein
MKSLAQELGIRGREENVKITTFGRKDQPHALSMVGGLEVLDCDENNIIPLPRVLLYDELPVDHEDVKDKELAESLFENEGLMFQKQDNKRVSLLIGVDAPKALKPLGVISTRDNGPYAIETALRWTVQGPLQSKGRGIKVN